MSTQLGFFHKQNLIVVINLITHPSPAERIAAALSEREPTAYFSIEGSCNLEAGEVQALKAQGRFLVEPVPPIDYQPFTRVYGGKAGVRGG